MGSNHDWGASPHGAHVQQSSQPQGSHLKRDLCCVIFGLLLWRPKAGATLYFQRQLLSQALDNMGGTQPDDGKTEWYGTFLWERGSTGSRGAAGSS